MMKTSREVIGIPVLVRLDSVVLISSDMRLLPADGKLLCTQVPSIVTVRVVRKHSQ
jgi:hypothetical protein